MNYLRICLYLVSIVGVYVRNNIIANGQCLTCIAVYSPYHIPRIFLDNGLVPNNKQARKDP